jgi:hypothetical protein
MKKNLRTLILCIGLILSGNSVSYASETKTCDRNCLVGMVDKLLVSMKQHSRKDLPLARWYRFTENGTPAAPEMTALWRTITDFTKPNPDQYVIDPKTGEAFIVAEVFESGLPSILFGRIKVENQYISEIELYLSRSKGESGLKFAPNELSHLPPAWSKKVSESQLPSRKELEYLGRSAYDRSYPTPKESADCELVEMGGRVIENPDALKVLMPGDKLATDRPLGHGVSVPCTFDQRPESKYTHIIVDEERGVVVSFGTVPGIVFPSFIEAGSESTFVPEEIRQGFENLPKQMRDPNSGTEKAFTPVLKEMKSTMFVAEMARYFDGKVQGLQRYMKMMPIGARNLWLQPSDK